LKYFRISKLQKIVGTPSHYVDGSKYSSSICWSFGVNPVCFLKKMIQQETFKIGLVFPLFFRTLVQNPAFTSKRRHFQLGWHSWGFASAAKNKNMFGVSSASL